MRINMDFTNVIADKKGLQKIIIQAGIKAHEVTVLGH